MANPNCPRCNKLERTVAELEKERDEWKWTRLGEANQDIAILEAMVKQRTKELEERYDERTLLYSHLAQVVNGLVTNVIGTKDVARAKQCLDEVNQAVLKMMAPWMDPEHDYCCVCGEAVLPDDEGTVREESQAVWHGRCWKPGESRDTELSHEVESLEFALGEMTKARDNFRESCQDYAKWMKEMRAERDALRAVVEAVMAECRRKCGCNPYGPLDAPCHCFDSLQDDILAILDRAPAPKPHPDGCIGLGVTEHGAHCPVCELAKAELAKWRAAWPNLSREEERQAVMKVFALLDGKGADDA